MRGKSEQKGVARGLRMDAEILLLDFTVGRSEEARRQGDEEARRRGGGGGERASKVRGGERRNEEESRRTGWSRENLMETYRGARSGQAARSPLGCILHRQVTN
ncbi:hypothetical protein KM043_003828 [Ampulex compressa]|nr:hypothetical protein KM043_003828 [Ampulex compressa]